MSPLLIGISAVVSLLLLAALALALIRKVRNGLLGPRPKYTTLSPYWECKRSTKRLKMRPMVAQEPFGESEKR